MVDFDQAFRFPGLYEMSREFPAGSVEQYDRITLLQPEYLRGMMTGIAVQQDWFTGMDRFSVKKTCCHTDRFTGEWNNRKVKGSKTFP